ncbi:MULTISPECIES: endopeptidase La [unclassified Oceanispirochaeta]|uniref:endopeptidase La n=1 Tax=unclassified Oceanispirochaeta TaxID=2635722 RepID=UPI000E093812|nr:MULTISPECIES: endopeptidase La [unclassified Oceanispirochaeta]MBF9014897.1 endopeptidase La [Oceanispirochaeta sp. M2]NPD71422.1 endopeptidase La [Oceanispirochaeta sp. M1]RDG33383.1 endopeptidase La [Oceanispirochaeta sp. M1]
MSEKEIIVAEQALPNKLFIVPLLGKPIFPGIFTPIMITSNDDIDIVNQAMDNDKVIGLILLKEEDENATGPEDIYQVGTAAKIVKKINLPDGGVNIFISTVKRFKIRKFFTSDAPLIAAVEYLDDIIESEQKDELKALTRSVISEMKQISEDNPLFSEEMRLNMVNIDNPGKIADFITSILNIDRKQQQLILEQLDVRARMEQVLVYIKKEQDLLRIQKKIATQINEKIEKSQREYFLREEIKAIKKELGEPVDSKSSEYLKFKEMLDKLDFEGEIKEQVDREMEKFSLMDPSSSEYIVTRNYLETIVNLPWEDPEPDVIDIVKGEKILNQDHYGLEDIKERIIEYLAVRKLKADTKGSIIVLVGPPGVGKTSIGKSIARALGREFFRFSVGGMRDEAEIKGHRRTYVGAMPGKIIQGLKIVKNKAPVFMIDEIDKLGQSYQGDPSSALLEVLDPEQNIAFRDHYLDLPYDLSHILFIATANTLDSIPRPLLDRMEIIRLSGYITDEKIEIAKRYLIPKSLKKHGLKKGQIIYNKTALRSIVDGYAREAGVRTFEKSLDKIHRKAARKIVMGTEELPIRITTVNLEDYLKKPIFRDDEIKKVTLPGMSVGLAWTSMGGDTLIIEAISVPGKGGLQLTGQMGDVMKESASIAYSHVKQIAAEYGIKQEFFEKNVIHLHIPEGATPKDGPSAGITMATALLSLAMGKVMKKNLAMTGELSLTGKVLPIGGLKEKTIAARRNKMKEIIIPKQNERDLDEIPEHIRKGIKFYPVETIKDVLKIVF